MSAAQDSNPLVSIVVPAYNHERFVQQTVRSLIDQTYPDLELIILNDGSTDGTAGKITQLIPQCRERFRRVEFVDKENEGVSETLNKGLRLAHGELIFHIASDDWVEPDAIELLVGEITKDRSILLACGDADFVDSAGNNITLGLKGREFDSFVQFHSSGKADFEVARDFGSYKSLLSGNYIPIGLLVRASIYDRLGCYHGGVMLEDLDLWLRAAKIGRMVFLPHVLAHYRVHNTNTVSVYRKELLVDYANLLIREREYCMSNGLSVDWNRIVGTVIVQLMRHGEYREFVKYILRMGVGRFLFYLVWKAMNLMHSTVSR